MDSIAIGKAAVGDDVDRVHLRARDPGDLDRDPQQRAPTARHRRGGIRKSVRHGNTCKNASFEFVKNKYPRARQFFLVEALSRGSAVHDDFVLGISLAFIPLKETALKKGLGTLHHQVAPNLLDQRRTGVEENATVFRELPDRGGRRLHRVISVLAALPRSLDRELRSRAADLLPRHDAHAARHRDRRRAVAHIPELVGKLVRQ